MNKYFKTIKIKIMCSIFDSFDGGPSSVEVVEADVGNWRLYRTRSNLFDWREDFFFFFFINSSAFLERFQNSC